MLQNKLLGPMSVIIFHIEALSFWGLNLSLETSFKISRYLPEHRILVSFGFWDNLISQITRPPTAVTAHTYPLVYRYLI